MPGNRASVSCKISRASTLVSDVITARSGTWAIAVSSGRARPARSCSHSTKQFRCRLRPGHPARLGRLPLSAREIRWDK
jgi:hypothetical protein